MSRSLLRWAVENSDVNAPPVSVERKDLDPAIIDAILGKPDAEQLKEDMAVATDVHRSEDERMDALDHMEMVRSTFAFDLCSHACSSLRT